MLSEVLLLQLMRQRKCVKTRQALGIGEAVLSRASCPRLYSGEYSEDESRFVEIVFQAVQACIPQMTDDDRKQLKQFMEIVLRNGRIHREDFLHRYLFEFWQEVCEIEEWRRLDQRFFKCQETTECSDFSRRLLGLIRGQAQHFPDIVALSGQGAINVTIVEVKNEPLDDRALGQILRYYQVTRSACDRLMTLRQTRRVCPILVVPDGDLRQGDLRFWDAVPFHFREVLEILFWTVDHTGCVVLRDGKAILRRLAGERISRNY
jgi:hypothetical protein